MKTHLKSVQRMFWTVVASSLLLIVLAIPSSDNAALMAALKELQGFEAGFDRTNLEAQLLEGVMAQGRINIQGVAKKVSGPGVPQVGADPSAAPIEPQAVVDLSSLEKVHALGQPGASADIATLDADSLAASISWRLADRGAGPGYRISSVSFLSGAATEEDLAQDRQVASARASLLAARRAATLATKKHASADELYRARLKWKAHWKAIKRANDKRQEAQADMVARNRELSEAQKRYRALSRKASTFKARSPRDGKAGAATVKLDGGEDGPLALTLPVAMGTRAVPVALRAPDFLATKEAGLWDSLKSDTADTAIAKIRLMFNWHYRYVEAGPVKVGGMTVLSFAPLLLIALGGLLILRSRGVTSTYNPFNRPDAAVLPTVGLGSAPLDLLALVGLPVTACVLCAWSLTQIQQFAVVPILCGLIAVGLGIAGHLQLRELRELRDAVRRSHSQAPPPPEA